MRKVFSSSKFLTFEKRKQYLIIAREIRYLLAESKSKPLIKSDFLNLTTYLKFLNDDYGEKFLSDFDGFIKSSEHRLIEELDSLMIYFYKRAEKEVEYENLLIEGDLVNEDESKKIDVFVFLDRIRSPKNVGAIYRVLENFGGKGVFLFGYTPDSSHKGVLKTSMGAEKWLREERVEDLDEFFNSFKERDGKVYILEKLKNGKSVWEFEAHLPSVVVLGNEELGVSSTLFRYGDEVITIPTYGSKNSLNVSHALAIFLYEFRRKIKI